MYSSLLISCLTEVLRIFTMTVKFLGFCFGRKKSKTPKILLGAQPERQVPFYTQQTIYKHIMGHFRNPKRTERMIKKEYDL